MASEIGRVEYGRINFIFDECHGLTFRIPDTGYAAKAASFPQRLPSAS
jgi:hypothetical protein